MLVALASIVVSWAVNVDAPLRKVAAVPLPDSPTRFDYQSIDPTSGRLYLSHMGDGRIVVFDTRTERVVADLDGYKTVTGVLAVPEEGKFYGSAAGSHEVVVADLRTNEKLARVPGVAFPDGIAYAPKERRIFVSDESGGIDLVIDARTNKPLGKVVLGGEVGNTHYDPVTGMVWVAVQSRNEMVSIDPATLKITGRHQLPGSDHPHGFTVSGGIAYVSCEGNDKLLVVNLRTMKVSQSFSVTSGPDVLVVDEGLKRLYVACEGGTVDVFEIALGGLKPLGKFSAPAGHTVSVDPKTHRVYLALKNVAGQPELWILEPTR